MLSKEQIIERMATPIHEGNSCTSWNQAKKSAEAALNALLDSLPKPWELLTDHEMYKMTPEEVMAHKKASHLYMQLVTMKGK